MSHEYRSVYWLFSLYAHANIGAIWGNHVNEKDGFSFRPKEDVDALITAADGLAAMTFGAIHIAFRHFGLDVKLLDVLRVELSKIRSDFGLHDSRVGSAS
jgi:hypothetical protein